MRSILGRSRLSYSCTNSKEFGDDFKGHVLGVWNLHIVACTSRNLFLTIPPAVEKQCSVAAKDNQLEPEEVQSSEESSDGWVKVEFSKEEELKKI
ncbi:hypothetical protein HN51_046569 [Arachis hypogaea]